MKAFQTTQENKTDIMFYISYLLPILCIFHAVKITFFIWINVTRMFHLNFGISVSWMNLLLETALLSGLAICNKNPFTHTWQVPETIWNYSNYSNDIEEAWNMLLLLEIAFINKTQYTIWIHAPNNVLTFFLFALIVW